MRVEDPVVPSLQQLAAQIAHQTLGRGTDVDACVALAAKVAALLCEAAERLAEHSTPLACRAGCNFCCHLEVRVLPHEAIALFRYLNDRMPQAKAAQVRATLGEYAQQHAEPALRRPCAFLIEGECAAYAVRPSACAGYHSLSKERCELSYSDPSRPAGTIALQSLQLVVTALEGALAAALQSLNLSAMPVELHAAVTALLQQPGLIAHWRTGRPLVKSKVKGAP